MAYKLVPKIKRKGYPTSSKKYKQAHKLADKAELKKYGKKKWDAVERIAERLPAGELAGKHTKRGKIIVSKKVPKKYRGQVAYHEQVEHVIMKRKKGK